MEEEGGNGEGGRGWRRREGMEKEGGDGEGGREWRRREGMEKEGMERVGDGCTFVITPDKLHTCKHRSTLLILSPLV